MVVATSTQKLNVVVCVRAAKRQWHDVVKVVVVTKRLHTTSAFSSLQLKQTLGYIF